MFFGLFIIIIIIIISIIIIIIIIFIYNFLMISPRLVKFPPWYGQWLSLWV